MKIGTREPDYPIRPTEKPFGASDLKESSDHPTASLSTPAEGCLGLSAMSRPLNAHHSCTGTTVLRSLLRTIILAYRYDPLRAPEDRKNVGYVMGSVLCIILIGLARTMYRFCDSRSTKQQSSTRQTQRMYSHPLKRDRGKEKCLIGEARQPSEHVFQDIVYPKNTATVPLLDG